MDKKTKKIIKDADWPKGNRFGEQVRRELETVNKAKYNAKLQGKIDKEITSLVSECWKHHKNRMKDAQGDLKKNDVLDFLDGCDLDGWEDIGWFIGYIGGLRFIKETYLN